MLKRLNFLRKTYPGKYFFDYVPGRYPHYNWHTIYQGLLPGVGLHYSMFYLSVQLLANPEQLKKWMPLIQNLRILGCYAQTELGHGSNVAMLETTAKYDKKTDEFVIHSPTMTSTKYWPGDLGRHSSHAIVFARLIIDDSDYGVQPFMTQIRDLDTWKHTKGVKTGDLGPKYGYTSKDNGWARFDHVRIPRENMLMGLSEVDREGNFNIIGDPRALYVVMMTIRKWIITESPVYMAQALTIALRYGAVRRQFKTIHG